MAATSPSPMTSSGELQPLEVLAPECRFNETIWTSEHEELAERLSGRQPYDRQRVEELISTIERPFMADMDNGITPLHWAASENETDAIGLLVKHGHPLNPQCHDFEPDLHEYQGRTPLHLAAVKGNEEAVRLLLRLGADPLVKTIHGQLAVKVAKKGCTELKKLLKKATNKHKSRLKEEVAGKRSLFRKDSKSPRQGSSLEEIKRQLSPVQLSTSPAAKWPPFLSTSPPSK